MLWQIRDILTERNWNHFAQPRQCVETMIACVSLRGTPKALYPVQLAVKLRKKCQTMTHKGLAESKREDYNSIYKPSTEQQARARREQALGDPASPDQVKIPYRFHRDR